MDELYADDKRIDTLGRQLENHIKSLKGVRREIESRESFLDDRDDIFIVLSNASDSVGYVMYWVLMMYYKASRGHSQLRKERKSYFTDMAIDRGLFGDTPFREPEHMVRSIENLFEDGKVMMNAYKLDITLVNYYRSSMNDLLKRMRRYVKLVKKENYGNIHEY